MKLFMSWSGKRSKEIAIIMKNWIDDIFSERISVWLSTEGDCVNPGSLFMPQIISGLRKCDCGIFCFTNENTNSPWMMFEAGALCMQDKVSLYTVLFEGTPESLNKTPLAHFQATRFDREEMHKFFKHVNNSKGQALLPPHDLQQNINRTMDIYYSKIVDSKSIQRGVAMNKEQLESQLIEQYFGKPHPGLVTFYERGFEDYPLYEILLKYATRRLWIFGRKNRKVFDDRNVALLKEIQAKPGFDFRCLFLAPESPEYVLNSAQDISNFKSSLIDCIQNAWQKLKSVGLEPNNIIRFYAAVREYAVIVIDDVVLFSPLLFKNVIGDEPQKPMHFTQAAFNVVSVNEETGKYHIGKFKSIWENAKRREEQP